MQYSQWCIGWNSYAKEQSPMSTYWATSRWETANQEECRGPCPTAELAAAPSAGLHNKGKGKTREDFDEQQLQPKALSMAVASPMAGINTCISEMRADFRNGDVQTIALLAGKSKRSIRLRMARDTYHSIDSKPAQKFALLIHKRWHPTVDITTSRSASKMKTLWWLTTEN